MSWVLKDEVDGNLSADYARPIRLYGVGAVGKATRCYSVLLYPAGAPLDVLRTAYHAGAGINVAFGTTSVALNGPASTNGRLTIAGTLNGNVESVRSAVIGTVNGILDNAAATKPLPSTSIFDTYKANATAAALVCRPLRLLRPGPPRRRQQRLPPPAVERPPRPQRPVLPPTAQLPHRHHRRRPVQLHAPHRRRPG